MAGLDTMIFPFYTEYWSFLVFFVLFSIGVVWRYSGSRWDGMFRNSDLQIKNCSSMESHQWQKADDE
uniref:Uncharacterized protein n=1 Tax=Caenorhabditis japonica TaxID=281687 RepID=A0A8R1ECQ7_CAEJA